jgi:hypothetical protein
MKTTKNKNSENSENKIIKLTNEEIWIIRYTLKQIQITNTILTDKNEHVTITDRNEHIIKLQLLYTIEELELINNMLTKIKYK